MLNTFVLLCLLNLFTNIVSQDCVDYGKRCADVGQCCGGCCFEGVCIETYRSCIELRNPCLDHYCPGGFECRIFKPDNCPECEIQALCSYEDLN